MNVGLDTSVVLRLLIGQPEDQTACALGLLDELSKRGDRALVSDLVAAEAYFALQYHYGISKKAALTGLRCLFADRDIQSTGVASIILETEGLATAKPGFVDRMIHRAYLDHGYGMATFEKAADKLKSVRVLGDDEEGRKPGIQR